MKSAILVLLPFAGVALASPATGEASKTLDLVGVSAVVITGEASSVKLTTSSAAPTTRRSAAAVKAGLRAGIRVGSPVTAVPPAT
ncbi:hypothetical protein NKH91_07300 [Mesorhizobium sp. M0894]|uniref:hypothetical protein n=1 Tax=unclassified Mesorhizobium TaxID=325217 RepID=UPI00333C769F